MDDTLRYLRQIHQLMISIDAMPIDTFDQRMARLDAMIHGMSRIGPPPIPDWLMRGGVGTDLWRRMFDENRERTSG